MMAKYNRQALLIVLKKYRQQIDEVIDILEKEYWQSLDIKLTATQQW
ncbi:hypothetical protein RINTHH_5630 [Richelia intracellularis HH01]|uniref:Uncharacterized protein n=1 Tax=Richelia intracellularis HH01 TaxID=1165094 RepID=M1WZE2_9NOST|nr:hypothetical protein RINTHH_5630 [Richelia intracellularis HH01]